MDVAPADIGYFVMAVIIGVLTLLTARKAWRMYRRADADNASYRAAALVAIAQSAVLLGLIAFAVIFGPPPVPVMLAVVGVVWAITVGSWWIQRRAVAAGLRNNP